MKDALELFGCKLTTPLPGEDPRETFMLVPSGNHRNQQRVQIQPAPPSSRAQVCPRCKGKLHAWVQTFPTDLYALWKAAAIDALRARYAGQVQGPVVVFLWIFGGRGFMESRDWDNVQKCVGDAIAEAKILPAPPRETPSDKEGEDDVRSIKGWRTHYLDRREHLAVMGKATKAKPGTIQARLFVQLVPADKVDPFRV